MTWTRVPDSRSARSGAPGGALMVLPLTAGPWLFKLMVNQNIDQPEPAGKRTTTGYGPSLPRTWEKL